MKILEVKDRNKILVEKLLEIWESSVKATHLFLSSKEIENIKKYVPDAIYNAEILKNENGEVFGIMGIENERLEMLFVSKENIGKYVYKRNELDEQGNPYPLLYMKIN